MADILSPTGIEKPLGAELHSRAQYGRNLDRINNIAINSIAGLKLALQAIGIHGANASFGTVPTLLSDLKVQFGSAPFTTDASGYMGVDMPAAFTSGYFVISMINGDGNANSNIMYQLTTGIFTNTASRFYVRAIRADSGVAIGSQTMRLNYIVIGH